MEHQDCEQDHKEELDIERHFKSHLYSLAHADENRYVKPNYSEALTVNHIENRMIEALSIREDLEEMEKIEYHWNK